MPACSTTTKSSAHAGDEWRSALEYNLSVLGARNWIVIAESSFPSYVGDGVTTVSMTQSSPTVFLEVLDMLERGDHVKPRIMVSKELSGISEQYAPGIRRYRTQINRLLPGRLHFELPNRIINGLVEDAMKQYRVLVIKTSTALPYSSIFIELDSGYWNSDSETALRAQIAEENKLRQLQHLPAPPPVQGVPPQQPFVTPVDQLPQLPKENKTDSSTPVGDDIPASPIPSNSSASDLQEGENNASSTHVAVATA